MERPTGFLVKGISQQQIPCAVGSSFSLKFITERILILWWYRINNITHTLGFVL